MSIFFEDFRCLEHTLQLAIQDSINSQRSVIDLLALARKIAGHFARSEQARRRLKEIQEHHGFRILQMVQSIPTRWNSIYSMLERLLEQKDALALYKARYDMPASLSANHWKIAESVCNLLYPFYDIIKVISEDDTPCSVTIPFVKTLMNSLSKDDERFHGVGTMKETLLESLERRFQTAVCQKNLMLATFLDPRFKQKYFADTQIEQIKRILSQFNQLNRINRRFQQRWKKKSPSNQKNEKGSRFGTWKPNSKTVIKSIN
ncbi:hypothetical protein JTE90_003437 [Oedothorax gibbosus]|uniref:Zinc finger BED domain-containing protein 4 n=1 Tax=Oedothorax gibbosus TaxID=931172 RepID=A0AAV6TYP3_9ARAC|nr:hypothetical protein JTE90_003437 [Oedothorax gibbosus]